MPQKIAHLLRLDGFTLVFQPSSRQLPLRFGTEGDGGPLNAFLASLAFSPSRLEEAAEILRRGQDVVRRKFRFSFVEPRDPRCKGDAHLNMMHGWAGSHAQQPFDGVTLLLEQHHARLVRSAFIAPSTLLAALDHLRRIGEGDLSSVLSAPRYIRRKIRIDGLKLRLEAVGSTGRLEFLGTEVAGAHILVHAFSGASMALAFHLEMWRTGGSAGSPATACWPLVYPYRGYETNPRFQAMKEAWQRARKRPLTQPVWVGSASWERADHYFPHSTLRRLSDLERGLYHDRSRFEESDHAYSSVKDLQIDGFPARRWTMRNRHDHPVKLTLPAHNPINWMVVDLESRFGHDGVGPLAFLRRGEPNPGPGTSFARFDLGHPALDHPAFAAMKASWEVASGRPLDEPVWKVESDWEKETAFIPQSSLERFVQLSAWGLG